jgi:hypothetical protein
MFQNAKRKKDAAYDRKYGSSAGNFWNAMIPPRTAYRPSPAVCPGRHAEFGRALELAYNSGAVQGGQHTQRVIQHHRHADHELHRQITQSAAPVGMKLDLRRNHDQQRDNAHAPQNTQVRQVAEHIAPHQQRCQQKHEQDQRLHSVLRQVRQPHQFFTRMILF